MRLLWECALIEGDGIIEYVYTHTIMYGYITVPMPHLLLSPSRVASTKGNTSINRYNYHIMNTLINVTWAYCIIMPLYMHTHCNYMSYHVQLQ